MDKKYIQRKQISSINNAVLGLKAKEGNRAGARVKHFFSRDGTYIQGLETQFQKKTTHGQESAGACQFAPRYKTE